MNEHLQRLITMTKNRVKKVLYPKWFPENLKGGSSTWHHPMWLMTVVEVRHAGFGEGHGFIPINEVDCFFVGRPDMKALYTEMGYLDQEVFDKAGIPELGIPDFERKYGKEEDS